MPQSIIEKIAAKYAVGLEPGQTVRSGDYISIRPAYVMTHDNTGAVIPKFRSMGGKKLADPDQVVHTLDHNVQDTSEKNLEKYRRIEEFSHSMGAHFYPAGRGIGHQIMIEEGFAWPGSLAVASDSHSNMYGGIGCLGTPIVRTDAAVIWATGRTWWQVPPIAKVELNGFLKPGVYGKDIIIALCGLFSKDEVLNHAIEFAGEGIKELSISQRLTIANMTTEWGALAGLFPIDEITIQWLRDRAVYLNHGKEGGNKQESDKPFVHPRINEDRIAQLERELPILQSDEDAFYSRIITIDLATIEPHVSGPNTVKVISPISEINKKEIKIDKAYLLSCVNSRVEDLAQAAAVLKGKKGADGVKFYIAAASDEVQRESELRGDWQILLDAGAIPLPAGCGPCIGLGTGLLEEGETGISATNRNFKGRMGSPNAFAYLASPAVVASSAAAGKIFFEWNAPPLQTSCNIKINHQSESSQKEVKIIDGFPPVVEGELLFCHLDNMNTDAIYPGKYTYNDDMTPEEQAKVVMENYDPDFSKTAKSGDILAGGFNFGTGSSREQAATALKYKGIKLVVAGSFNETYKRNALNNGFLLIESPEFINDLKIQFGTGAPTVKTGLRAKIDFSKSEILFNSKKYNIGPVGTAAQELITAGGIEIWGKNNLGK